MTAVSENRLSYLTSNRVVREPLLISLLVIMAVGFFVFTHAYSQAYDHRREQLGKQWQERARQNLAGNHADAAVEEFRTALAYLPQCWDCRLGLAGALMRAGKTRQAQQYFEGLWQLQPQNGMVNLALARLSALGKNVEEAERYYNGAIFGDWTDQPEQNRREATFELIQFHLQRRDYRQAESQLITVSGNLPDDPALQIRVADFFMTVGDLQRALDFYKRAARRQPQNLAALLGAANAAFQSGDYHMAESYAGRALHEDSTNADASHLRELAQVVLQLDPSARGLNSTEKARRAVLAYHIVGDRLAACGQQAHASSGPVASPIAASLEKWIQWKPYANLPALVGNPDRVDELFDFSLQAEQSAQALCGQPSLPDDALRALVRKRSAEDK